MPLGPRAPRRRATAALSLAFLALLASCSSSKSSAGTTTSSSATSAAPTTTAPAATTSSAAATTTPTVVAAKTEHVPSSCSAIPVAVISPAIGGVGSRKSFPTKGGGVSCQFANPSATKIVILDIGHTNASTFATLRTTTGTGGRTVASVSGIGATAFSVSNKGVPGGVSVLSAQNVAYIVESNLPFATDEALIRQLMALP